MNKYFHPLIRTGIKRIIEEYVSTHESGDNQELIIVEVPLLFESGWMSDFERIIVVYSDRENCLSRIIARDRVSRNEAEAAIHSQMPLAEKLEMADIVIDNNGDKEWTRRQAEKVLKELQTAFMSGTNDN